MLRQITNTGALIFHLCVRTSPTMNAFYLKDLQMWFVGGEADCKCNEIMLLSFNHACNATSKWELGYSR